MTESTQLAPVPVGARGKPKGRFGIAFGRRFFLLLLIGLVWIGPAWASSKYLLAMALWDLLVLFLWAADLARLPKPEQIELRRLWHSTLQLREPADATLQFTNRGNIEILLRAQEEVPVGLRKEIPEVNLRVPPGASQSAAYSVCPRERGDMHFGITYLRYQSPWQIAERWATASLNQTIRIYPNFQESKKDTIYLIRSRQIALEKRYKHQPGQGREFESLRDYRESDEWRDICWSATARRAKLISKAYQIERSQTVWLVLDAGRLLRTRVRGLSKLDYAVGAALSLAQVALYSGDRVAMLGYGRRVLQRLPPGRGPRHIRALLDGLALVRAEELEADHRRAMETLAVLQKRRSLVVWLTDLAETATIPEVIESAMHMAERHLVLFTVIGQPELRSMVKQRPEDPRQMFRQTAAMEIVQRRDLLLRTLRQHGALTLEVEPLKLSTAVVNQYLMAKDRSLI
ncbi:MAG TPA: DUF58 domain-containing protein [Candidatus Eremiobacteraceae bacterium]|nr:DUF58 domain-containing protein [Candidatus Eremiobacteraceae bacterium]